MSDIPFTPTVRDLPAVVPFVGPEALTRARGRPFKARLGANENGFGPSPKAVEAMAKSAAESWMYGDPENYDLIHALADYHGIPADNIVIGTGIDGLFGTVAQMFIDPGVKYATSLGGYPTFNYQMAAQGGVAETTPFVDDREDIEGLLALATRTGARLIYLANPDNPMGTWWNGKVLAEALTRVPAGSIFCLDEAYCDLAPADSIPPFDLDNPRVLRFRTFSKAYGLAGARIGYAIGHKDVIKAFDKVRNHFGVSRIAQAGALAALEDRVYFDEVVAKIDRARTRLSMIAEENGLSAVPSATNFVAIDCGRDGAFSAKVMEGLTERDIFVRKPGAAPLDRCIRVSVGPDEEMDLFAAALKDTLKDLRG